jgi:hypothetical protein
VRHSGARETGGRRVAERPVSPASGTVTKVSALMPLAVLSAAWMVGLAGDVSDSDATAAERTASPLQASLSAQPLIGRHAARPERGMSPVGATLPAADASIPTSGPTVGTTSQATTGPSSQSVGPSSASTPPPNSAQTSTPTSGASPTSVPTTTGDVGSTLTAAEAQTQCLEDGVSALDVAAMTACIDSYLD